MPAAVYIGIEHNLQQVADKMGLVVRDLHVAARGLERETEQAALSYFHQTVATWTHQPVFTVERLIEDALFSLVVGTDDAIYAYADKGTRPHYIKPRHGAVLAFAEGYTPKTRVGRVRAVSGGAFGNTVFATSVYHPGTAPRNFTQHIQEVLERRTQRRAEQVVRKWVDEANR